MKVVNSLLMLMLISPAIALGQAQYKVLWNFAGAASGDGAFPVSNLTFDKAGNLYGTTSIGGNSAPLPCPSGCGTVFELSPTPDGTWTETVIYSFCSTYVRQHCVDGAAPLASLLFDAAGNLYGTTYTGGANPCPTYGSGCGTVFKLSPPTTPGENWTEKVLYSFCANNQNNICLDGALPAGHVTRDAAGNLYGTTSRGGSSSGDLSAGTIFKLSHGMNGWSETVLYSFCSQGHDSVCPDGATPMAGVTFDKAGNLYGTTEGGGSQNSEGGGTLYKLSPGPSGWNETVLLASYLPAGSAPLADVTIDVSGRLYTTFSTGAHGGGGIVQVIPGGGHNQFSFSGANGSAPKAGVLIDSANAVLYGATYLGGTNGLGTLFRIETPGNGSALYSFCAQPNCADGEAPIGGVIKDNSGNLYGTTNKGGTSNFGVVYEFTLPAPIKRNHGAGAVSLLGQKSMGVGDFVAVKAPRNR